MGKPELKKRCLFKLYSYLLQCSSNATINDDDLLNYLNDLKINFESEYHELMN